MYSRNIVLMAGLLCTSTALFARFASVTLEWNGTDIIQNTETDNNYHVVRISYSQQSGPRLTTVVRDQNNTYHGYRQDNFDSPQQKFSRKKAQEEYARLEKIFKAAQEDADKENKKHVAHHEKAQAEQPDRAPAAAAAK